MIDPVLEQRLNSCRQLMKAWNHFHSYLTAAMKEGMQFDGKAENDFLALKSQIAILHDSFLDSIQKGSREAAATSQSVITIVERCVLLRQVSRMSVAELKRMEMEWHEAYLLINDTIGILEEQVTQLAEVSQMSHAISVLSRKIRFGVQSIVRNQNALGAVIVLGILIALTVLPMMGVFNYDFLDKQSWAKTPYRVTRNLFRATVMKELQYLDLAEYKKYGRGSIGLEFDDAELSDKEKEDAKNFMEGLMKDSGLTASESERYRARQGAENERALLNTTYAIFDTVEHARAAETKALDTIDSKKELRAGRRGNVIYWIQMIRPRRGVSPEERFAPVDQLDEILREGLSKKKDK